MTEQNDAVSAQEANQANTPPEGQNGSPGASHGGKEMSVVDKALTKAEEHFNRLVECYDQVPVHFNKEAGFARQMVMANGFLHGIAERNPGSLKRAIINVAAIGITLNPVLGYAYLVPRDGKVCLDISYKGLLKIATDSGAIRWGRAEVVREGDELIYNGPSEKVGFSVRNPFSKERREAPIIGVFCEAKTSDGDILSGIMDIDELNAIRDRSQAYIAYIAGKIKSCPWVTDIGEMYKKTILKREQKTWPKSHRGDRLEVDRLTMATHVLNEHEGYEVKDITPKQTLLINEEQVANLESLIDEVGADSLKFMAYYGVEKLSDIPEDKYSEAVDLLEAKRGDE